MQSYVLLMLLAFIQISHLRKVWPLLENTLGNRENKEVTTNTLDEVADIVLKNNYFQFLAKTFKQKQGTAIGTK